ASCLVWYGDLACRRYPGLMQPFRYTGMYMPTADFRDMNLEISNLSVDEQVTYETGLRLFGNRLAQVTGVVPGPDSVIIDYYQVLPGDVAVVVEGFAYL